MFGFFRKKPAWQREIDKRAKAEKALDKKLEDEKRRADYGYFKEQERIKKEFGKRFKCCVCGKPSKIPAQMVIDEYDTFSQDSYGGTTYTHTTYGPDYDSPADRIQCQYCNMWVCNTNNKKHYNKCKECGRLFCSKHIYRGVCKECAEERR